MADNQYPCPECGTVLRPKNPLTAGKKIKCPKCATVFAPVGGGKAADDDEGGTYGFNRLDDQADEATKEERKKAMGPLKTRGKSARGPAQAAVTPPSNKMLGTAVITCVSCVITAIAMLWPIIFSSNKKPDATTEAVSNKKYVEETPEQRSAKVWNKLSWLAFAVAAFLYNGVVAVAAVKMQSLESYKWATAGAIMIMFPVNWLLCIGAFKWFTALVTAIAGEDAGGILSLTTVVGVDLFYVYVGLWNFRVLRQEDVVAGFQEEAPKD